jgi:hypothetical protein
MWPIATRTNSATTVEAPVRPAFIVP